MINDNIQTIDVDRFKGHLSRFHRAIAHASSVMNIQVDGEKVFLQVKGSTMIYAVDKEELLKVLTNEKDPIEEATELLAEVEKEEKIQELKDAQLLAKVPS